MKKTILISICLLLSLVVTLTGTIAYLTDTETAANVMTLGSVSVELQEFQRDGNGGLIPFKHDLNDLNCLYPAVGEVEEQTDGMGLPVNPSFQDKIVRVVSTGKRGNAYLRVYIGVPSALRNVNGSGRDAVHLRFANVLLPETKNVLWTWSEDADHHRLNEDISGVSYDMLCYEYTKPLKPGEVTPPVLAGLWMDSDVGNKNGGYTFKINGTEYPLDYDIANGLQIPVLVQAIQTENFRSAEQAFEASGMNAIRFGEYLSLRDITPAEAVNRLVQMIQHALQGGQSQMTLPGGQYDLSADSAEQLESALNGRGMELRVQPKEAVEITLGDSVLPDEVTLRVEAGGRLVLKGN